MRVRSLAAWSCLTAALAFGVAACGDDDSSGGGGVEGQWQDAHHLLVASAAGRFPPAVRGRRPWRAAGARGGRRQGRRASRSSTCRLTTPPRRPASGSPARSRRTPARRVGDDNTIAYLGEFNSGASAISIPLLNEAGILQVSPSNTYVGLTRSEGAEKGEPEKYYPSGTKTYGARRARRPHPGGGAGVLHEGRGRHEALHPERQGGLREGHRRPGREDRARSRASRSSATTASTPRRRTSAPWRSKIKSSGADCFFFGGITQNKGVQVFKDVTRRQPGHQDVRPRRRRRVGRSARSSARRWRRTSTSPTRRSTRRTTRRRHRSSSRSSRPSTARTRSPTRSTATRP